MTRCPLRLRMGSPGSSLRGVHSARVHDSRGMQLGPVFQQHAAVARRQHPLRSEQLRAHPHGFSHQVSRGARRIKHRIGRNQQSPGERTPQPWLRLRQRLAVKNLAVYANRRVEGPLAPDFIHFLLIAGDPQCAARLELDIAGSSAESSRHNLCE